MEFLQALSEWPGAVMMRRFQVVYLLVNASHIISISLVVGAIVTLDLKLLGLFRPFPIATLAPPLSRVSAAGIMLAILTGLLLFSVRPAAYIQNTAFLIKVALIVLGIANALLLKSNFHWKVALAGGELHKSVRVSAFLSVALWFSAVIAGRWIGFL